MGEYQNYAQRQPNGSFPIYCLYHRSSKQQRGNAQPVEVCLNGWKYRIHISVKTVAKKTRFNRRFQYEQKRLFVDTGISFQTFEYHQIDVVTTVTELKTVLTLIISVVNIATVSGIANSHYSSNNTNNKSNSNNNGN